MQGENGWTEIADRDTCKEKMGWGQACCTAGRENWALENKRMARWRMGRCGSGSKAKKVKDCSMDMVEKASFKLLLKRRFKRIKTGSSGPRAMGRVEIRVRIVRNSNRFFMELWSNLRFPQVSSTGHECSA